MLDFGALPPELNSARMYAGPGPGSMLAAAAAWQSLADELNSAAANYGSVVSTLTSGPWTGPSSSSMAAAVAPYVTWLGVTGEQAEQTATQATAAAGAYETAYAATVPPPLIAANRSLLAMLVATNFLGQNTPAIAATEAHYGEMWAQSAAMYGYAGSSATAAQVTPFATPPQTTNPGWTDRTGRRGRPGRRHLRRDRRRDDHVVGSAADFRNAPNPAEPRVAPGLGKPRIDRDRFVVIILDIVTVDAEHPEHALADGNNADEHAFQALHDGQHGKRCPSCQHRGQRVGGGPVGWARFGHQRASVDRLRRRWHRYACHFRRDGSGHLCRGAVRAIQLGCSAFAGAVTAMPFGGTGAIPAAHAGAPSAMPPMMPVTNLAARDGSAAPSRFELRSTVIPFSPAGG